MRMKRFHLLTAAVLAFCLVAGASFAAEKVKWFSLFNGKNLNGWKLRDPKGRQSWSVVDGVLDNDSPHGKPGTDLLTTHSFNDCMLHIEFNVPKGGNSGVYLQGLYEIQVADSHGQPAGKHMCGAIYGKIAPTVNPCKPAGEWQTFDITFRQARLDRSGQAVEKARITVIHNGQKIIDDEEIDGKTGGALGGKEGTAGPLMLQGNHSSVQYRNIHIRPFAPKPKILKPKPVILKPIVPTIKPVEK
jgi:hypothetical protein